VCRRAPMLRRLVAPRIGASCAWGNNYELSAALSRRGQSCPPGPRLRQLQSNLLLPLEAWFNNLKPAAARARVYLVSDERRRTGHRSDSESKENGHEQPQPLSVRHALEQRSCCRFRRRRSRACQPRTLGLCGTPLGGLRRRFGRTDVELEHGREYYGRWVSSHR
jgi:hypothetical protein